MASATCGCGCAKPGPRGSQGPPGPPGSGVPCVSTDPGNVATIGGDGCVYVPPGDTNMQGSPCIAVAGDGSGAAPFTPTPVLHPAACNGLQCTPSGLLAPETRVTGFVGPAPGRQSSDFPSVDTVVTPPAADTCPQTYQVKAYVTPERGAIGGGVDIERAAPDDDAWFNTQMVAALPEPGVYFISADVWTQICAFNAAAPAPGSFTNLWTLVRAINSAGTPVIGQRIGTQHQVRASPTTQFQMCNSATASLSGLVTVTAANASDVIRIQFAYRGSVSNGGDSQYGKYGGALSRLSWWKVSD